MGTLNQDLDDIKAIEDKLTANKVAKFAYTDHAYNNPLTEADGVTYYNVDNEQNIPVADPSVMDVNETVLTKGWRSQASSITRMLMNHFLGRVSYNLNKLNDNMSALLATLISHLGSANGIAPLNASGVVDIAKGGTGANSANGAKTNLGLNNVVNTGDSANASSGGTAKFTTGGAYNLLTSIAPYFSASTAYAVGTLVTYQNRLYECTTAHSAGAWNANHFTARSVQYVINNYILPSLAPAFSTSTPYAIGDFVTYQNRLYRCTTAHSAGAWNASHFELANINNVTSDTDGKLALKADLLDLASAFSASTSYAVGDYVTYNGDMYRCTVAHSGAWNASHFTLVTVGSDLALKADKTSLALPTDAVLHYSFDDVPDYPDGTADVRLLDNNTYDIQSTDYAFTNDGSTTLSNSNGKLLLNMNGTSATAGAYIGTNSKANKTIKLKLNVQSLTGTLKLHFKPNVSVDITSVGIYEYSFNNGMDNRVAIYTTSGNSADVLIEAIYIGDGSYSTPIIDNANGQNNSVSAQCFVANKGVSGKGVTFYNGTNKTIRVKWDSSNWDRAYTVSCWVKVNNSNIYIIGWDTNYAVQNHFLRYNNEQKTIWFDVNENTRFIGYICTVDLDDGKWHNIVAINKFESGKSEIWVDGGKQTLTTQYRNLGASENYFLIGTTRVNTDYADATNSQLDDFLFFDRALSDTEVQALYLNKANTPKYYGEVPVTRKINGHTLEEDVTLTKSDVGLGNVANTGDSAVPAENGTTKFTTGGAYTELAKKVDKTTTVNGHELNSNVTVTKGDVGLGNVANTGDSATPAANGTDKFTTGGAYNFFGNQTDAKEWLHYICAPLLGRNWRAINVGGINAYRDLATNGEGRYVLAAGNSIYTSNNGVSFTHAADINAWALHYSTTWHKWFALAQTGLYVSIDRLSWSRVTTVTTGAGAGARIVEGFSSGALSNILYIATSNGLWYTTNGTSWTRVSGTSGKVINALDYAGVFWFASSTTGDVWCSTNGVDWTSISGDIASSSTRIHKFVLYNGVFLACSTTGLWQSSDNGVTWTRNSTIGSVNVPSIAINKNNCVVLTDTKAYFTSTNLANLADVFSRVDDNTFKQIAYNGYIWVLESIQSSWYSLDGQHWLYASKHADSVTSINKLLYIDNCWYSLTNSDLLISDLQTA